MKPYSSNFSAGGVSIDGGFVLVIPEDPVGSETNNKQKIKMAK
jgi:hypothetical protein